MEEDEDMLEQEQATRKDFFISYIATDRLWAEWIAWQLEEVGYSVILQKSFPSEPSFVQEINTALEETNNIIALFSPDYVDALSMSAEWSEALSVDPSGKQRTLVPVQVHETRNRLKSILPLISYLDLVGLDEQEARKVLLEGMSSVSSKPPSSPFHTLITVGQPRFPDSFPSIWIPYARNPYFTGREALLTRLAEALRAGNIMSVGQPQAISGLGGIGKTQLAVEYAYRYRRDYEAVFWVMAESRESLITGYADIARRLGLPQHSEHDQALTILAVKQWLQTHLKWLLILDNADDVGMVHEFLPSARSGHIILTTRAYSTGTLAKRLEVETLDLEEGALLLLRRVGLIQPNSTLEEALPADIDQARILVQELGGLPLALDQAGAYIQETGCNLLDYTNLYRARRTDLLKLRGSIIPDHPEPVATTWKLTFEKVSRRNPAAVELLQLCAFLAPDDIPEELIIVGAPDIIPNLKSIVADPIAWNSTIATLLQYSLIHRDSSNKTLSIHRLVQAVLRDGMGEVDAHRWAEQAVRIVSQVFPSGEFETWMQCDRLLPHALLCVEWVERYHLFFPEVTRLLNRTGYYFSERARYGEAETLWQRALAISEQELGDHPDTAMSLNNLAQLYQRQGKYEEAEPLYVRALHIREQTLGPEHPEVAYTLYGLANLYYNQGKYEQAEPLYVRALHIREQTLGPEHPQVASSLNNLALLYADQGKYEEVEPLYVRALHIWEQTLGLEHPEVAYPLYGLANLYYNQGKYEQAEQSYERALHIWERTLGPEHPNVAYPLYGLANLYYNQDKYEQAEQSYERTLHIWERTLGPEHPNVAYLLNNLAEFYQLQSKYEQAEQSYERALHIWEQALGPEHSNVAYSLYGLANLYSNQGKYEQAEQSYERALHIWEQALGPEHPNVAYLLNDLAELYQRQSKYEQADPLYLRTLHICEQALGISHLLTQKVTNNYLMLLRAMKRETEADDLEARFSLKP